MGRSFSFRGSSAEKGAPASFSLDHKPLSGASTGRLAYRCRAAAGQPPGFQTALAGEEAARVPANLPGKGGSRP